MSNDTQSTSTRRKFLGMAGMMGAGAVLSGCTNVMATTPSQDNGLDAAIFNFALNLEYLEAAFYLAAVGRLNELTAAGGDASKVILPAGYDGRTMTVPGLTGDTLAMAHEIADDELAHVKVIRSVLKGAAVAQPRLDLGPAFAAAGNAASKGAITNFNPYAAPLFFLHGAFVFEDVGVTAYKGAARFIDDQKAGGNLENAAGILAVEAYHAGAVRTLLHLARNEQVTPMLKVQDVVQAISDLRDSVDGADDRDQGIVAGAGNPGVPARSANIVPTDANGIAFSRTPRQVANIVFLGGTTKGGFFPDGLTDDGNLGKLLAIQ
ncbi:ferritin-like domain-containing protein [Deinococcus sp. MIMF12]|uniref:Ferritin-like domain-containing protein n=1 Tax=Deinococcus rhizophilus TaxID=3049544 RepID=A0ABT7JKX2_9DEIO|nr:ferritin-like domain-containing protein [Deinococcus rhizophilus]MDL2345689.1 ferritin-like domain-containing protein [Deinococcus rhizophilus]